MYNVNEIIANTFLLLLYQWENFYNWELMYFEYMHKNSKYMVLY